MLFGMRFSLGEYYAAFPNCFDELQLPTNIDRETLIATILSECADFGIASNVRLFPQMVKLWGKRRAYSIEKIMETTLFEYNPISNYDRTETTTDTDNQTSDGWTKNDKNDTGSSTDAGWLHSDTDGTDNTSTTISSAGVDSVLMKDDTNTAVSGTTKTVQQNSSNNTVNSTVTTDEQGSHHNETGRTVVHSSRISGNIGVTTSQQMIEAERALVNFDPYLQIARIFAHDLLIPLYI